MEAWPKFTLKDVQQFKTDPATGLRKLVAEHHYVRVRAAMDQPPLFLQHGRCWDEGERLIDPVPDWVLEFVETMPAAARKLIGWDVERPDG